MNNFTVKQKLYTIFAIILCLTVALGMYASTSLKSQSKQTEIMLDLMFADAALYASRLAQADYMIQETPEFDAQVMANAKEAIAKLQSAQSMMEVDASIARVDKISSDITEFTTLFREFVTHKKALIQSRTTFDNTASAVGSTIDDTLASIGDYFNQNQNDFSEFGRYLSAKKLRDDFNEVRVEVWKYNSVQSLELEHEIAEDIKNLQRHITNIKAQMQSATTLQLLTKLTALLNEYNKVFNVTVANYQLLNSVQLKMLKTANMASDEASVLVDEELLIQQQDSESAQWMMMVIIIVISLIAAVLAWWLIQSIIKPLQLSINFAEKIAKGELNQQIATSGKDEFSQLNTALSKSASSLKHVIEQLVDVIRELEQLASLIANSVNGASNSVQQQQIETDMVATAINEMAAAAMEIAQSASDASNTSQSAEISVETSKAVVLQTEEAMSELAESLNHASQAVNKLSENSANIEGILDVIRGIADQTNLLALNAAIEAARAGEQGRGFAVVADEVRTLAQKTQASISEITHIIEAIQTGASNVVNVMISSNEKSNLVVSLTTKSSESLTQIVRSIDEIVATNNQVAVGAEEQSSVAAEMDNTVVKIKMLADDNSQNLESIQQQAASLVNQTQNMTKLIGFFKVK